MDITKYVKKGLISLRVTPHAATDKIVDERGELKVYLTAIADKNKANLALIKFFKQEFNLRVQIKSGDKSRNKVLEVIT